MERIASFTVDHNKLNRGMYISRVDGEVTTYDIRTRKPNVEEVMENGAIHTLEHLFATFVRNSKFKEKYRDRVESIQNTDAKIKENRRIAEEIEKKKKAKKP